MKTVCVGDSITAGQHLAHGWPWYLENAVAKGVCGDTSRLMLERFPLDVQSQMADVVVIQVGHNDCNRWNTDRGLPRVSARAYEANLREMIERTVTFGAAPILCSLTPPLASDDYADDVEFYNDILLLVAFDLGVAVADVRSRFSDQALEPLLLEDGLHLSDEGHRQYANTVHNALSAILTAF